MSQAGHIGEKPFLTFSEISGNQTATLSVIATAEDGAVAVAVAALVEAASVVDQVVAEVPLEVGRNQ